MILSLSLSLSKPIRLLCVFKAREQQNNPLHLTRCSIIINFILHNCLIKEEVNGKREERGSAFIAVGQSRRRITLSGRKRERRKEGTNEKNKRRNLTGVGERTKSGRLKRFFLCVKKRPIFLNIEPPSLFRRKR